MFIESVTFSGFLSVAEAQKFNFKLQDSVENLIGVSYERSLLLLKAFSVVFDSSFDGRCDLSEFINPEHDGESFVEFVLWQNDQNKIQELQWLQQNHLTLRRNLREPSHFLVNDTKLKAETVQKSLASLGFMKINDFLMHSIQRREIKLLSCFTGDDLWSLIQKLNSCEELVQIIEIRHLSKIIASDKIKHQISEVESILPQKLKLRDDFRTYNQHMKKFNTLLNIVDKRKLKFLDKEKLEITKAIDELKQELIQKSEEFNAKRLTIYTPVMKMKSVNRKVDLLFERTDEITRKISRVDKFDEENFARFSKFHESAKSNARDFDKLLEEMKSHDIHAIRAQLAAAQWKSQLKLGGPKTRKKLQDHLGRVRKTIDFETKQLNDTMKDINFCKNNLELPEADLEERILLLEQIFAHDIEITTLRDKIIDHEQEIGLLQLTTGDPYMKTLLTVERVMQQHPNLSYLGPVFKNLRSHREIEIKMWPALERIAKRFLFIEGKDARKANRILVESGVKIGNYEFVGLDEYSDIFVDKIPENVTSAEIFVKGDTEERLKQQLKSMLRGVLLVEAEDDVGELENVLIHSDGCVKWNDKGKIYFYAIDPLQTESPVQQLLKAYEIVLNCCDLEHRIESEKSGKTEIENSMEPVTRYNVGLITMALDRLKQKLQDKAGIVEKLTESTTTREILQELVSWKPESSSEEELENLKEKLQSKLDSMEKSQENLRAKMNHSLKKLEISTKLLKSMESLHVSSNVCHSALLAMLPKYENYLKLLVKEIKILQSTQETDPVFELPVNEDTIPTALDDRDLQEEILSIKSRLESKVSENVAINSAIALCSDENSNIDEDYYKQFHKESAEKISEELMQQKQNLKEIGHMNSVSDEQYGHLITTIKKIKEYSQSKVPFYARNKLASKSFPVMNKFFVKILKDVVFNYQSSFKSITSDSVRKCQMFFYTRDHFEEIETDNFNWECFDMSRLKSMEFNIEWRRNTKKIELESLRKIKGLLLIMQIISYMSVFKFVIIDEEFFDNMEFNLAENIRAFLKTVSAYVQVFMIEKEIEDEPMEVSA